MKTRTNKALILALGLSLVGLISSPSRADQYNIDYPHYQQETIGCDSCHYMVYDTPPTWATHVPLDIDDTPYNVLCWSCHNDVRAPYEEPHSSLSTSNQYGAWSIECRTCHWPHQQMQLRTYGTASYVYTSTSTGLAATTLTKTGAGWTIDQWKGYLLVPNTGQISYNYKITANTATTLTVDPAMDLTKAAVGNTFAIIYGKLIKSSLPTPNSGARTVKLFRTEGANSFADNNAIYDGVCEVCHTKPRHFRNDGSASDQTHTNVGGAAGTNCISCHPHSGGFGHGSGGSGGGCIECHGHDAGYEYSLGEFSQGKGTVQAHSTHTENDNDDKKGPNIACGDCHDPNKFPYFKSGTDSNIDGKIDLSETDVCNNCHSPGGAYNGVNTIAQSVGAKDNWDTGIYESDGITLKAGKQKWCAGCHDEVSANSKADGSGIYAPNVIGDEDAGLAEGYQYGTGYGFYKTGHGLAGGTYPASGGPAANAECTDCHNVALAHIDHDSRTYVAANNNYQAGYRLKYNMDIPRTDPGWPIHDFELCAQCHDIEPFINKTYLTTNLRIVKDSGTSTNLSETVLTDNTKDWGRWVDSVWVPIDWAGTGAVLIPDIDKPWNAYPIISNTFTELTVNGSMLSDGAEIGDFYRFEVNSHRTHLQSWSTGPWASNKWDSDWTGGTDSKISCPHCHNVHGSTFARMTRDGKLTGGSLGFYYFPPTSYPNSTTLPDSTGGRWSLNLCGPCHSSSGTYSRVAKGTVQLSSASDQFFSVGDPATEISPITITDNARAGTLTATGDIRIRIPDTLNMTWDISDTSAVMGGSAIGKVNAAVSFPDNKILLIDVTADFSAGDTLTVSGLNFADFSDNSGTDNLELYIENGHVLNTKDSKTILIGTKATISSAADQTFAVNDGSTAISPITIRAITNSADVNSSNDIRIKIPATTSMIWDSADTAAVIEGTASGKVNSTVSFPDNKTLLIDVTGNFVEGETITISGLSFKDFTASSNPDNLELYVDGASDVTVDGLDDKNVTIESLHWIMPTAVEYYQCWDGSKYNDMQGCDYLLDNNLTTTNLWPGYVAIFDLGREYLVTDLRLYVSAQAQWRFYMGNLPYGCLSGGTQVLDNWVIGASGAGWYERAVTSQVSGRYLRVQYDAGGHAPEYLSELRFYGFPQDEATVISTADALDKNGGLAGIQSGDQVILTFDHRTGATPIDGDNIETALILNNGHTWGTITDAVWSDAGGRVNDTLTITLDTGATVAFNDTITMGSVIKDARGGTVTGSVTLKGSFDVLEPIQIIVDNENANNQAGTSFEFVLGAEQAGEWVRSTGCSGHRYLADYFYAPVSATGETLKARWNFTIPWTGMYHVYAYYPTWSERPFDARFTVNHAGGGTLTPAHQRSTCSGAGRCVGGWEKMGTFYFNAGSNSVELSNFSEDNPAYFIYADAIKIESITWFDGSDTEIILDNPAVEFIIDDTKGTPLFTGEDGYYLWPRSSCQSGYNGYMNQIGTDGGGVYSGRFAAKWVLYFLESGTYHVYGYWPGYWSGYANNTPVTINHAGGTTELRVNQRDNYNQWYDLGEYDFNAGQDQYIMLSNDNSGGNPIADAIKLIRVEP